MGGCFTFGGAVVDVGDSLINNCRIVMKVVVEFTLVNKLRVFGIYGLNFHCNFEIGLGIDGLVDLSEGSFINLANDFEVLANLLQHLRH